LVDLRTGNFLEMICLKWSRVNSARNTVDAFNEFDIVSPPRDRRRSAATISGISQSASTASSPRAQPELAAARAGLELSRQDVDGMGPQLMR
jgi:hypothetical protein